MPDLNAWSLLAVLALQLLIGLPIGVLLLPWIELHDVRERVFAGMAAPAAGILVVDVAAGIVSLLTGRVALAMYAAIIVTLLATLLLLARRQRRYPGPQELTGALLALGLAFLLGAFVYAPVRDFPAAPDIDGTADAYMATMAKIGGTFPRIHPLGDEEFIQVNAPPSGIVPGAYVSRITGISVPRVQLGRSGGAWVLYILAFPFVAYGFFARTRFPVLGPIMATVFTYSVSMKWTYYDGSNLRMFGILGLALATGLFVRSLEGSASHAYATGVLAGLTLYFHQRYFLYCALLFGGFGLLRLVVLTAVDRPAARTWLAQALRMAAAAAIVGMPFVVDKLPVLLATNDNPFWAQPRYTPTQAYARILRFQGGVAFFGAIVAAFAFLVVGRRRVQWRYLAFGVTFQAALCFEFAHYFLAPIRTYVDASTTIISGLNDLRPIALAGLLLLPAGLLSAREGSARRRAVAAGGALTLAAVYFYVSWATPVTARYVYLTRSDVQVLRWLRHNTPVEGTLILNYPWQDLPDARLQERYGHGNPRGRYNHETYWVAPVAERRAVFHWLNRLTYQGRWNVVKASSPGLQRRLDELAGAYLDPCAPGSEQIVRSNGITHVFVTALMHTDRWQALTSCPYLRLAFVAPPPYDGYIGFERSGFRPRDRRTAAAVYEVVSR